LSVVKLVANCKIKGTGATSVLLWGGAANGTMLHDNGTSYYTLEGLTFDGNGVGGIGLLHNHSSKNNYGSLIYHVNLAFHNLTCVRAALHCTALHCTALHCATHTHSSALLIAVR